MDYDAGLPSAELAIEAGGLTKRFGSFPALRGVDLTVRWGESLVIFGPNGAGKTSLIRILSTQSRPSSGRLAVAGLDPQRHAVDVKRRIGVVSHQTFLYDHLTAYENLRFYGRMYAVPDLAPRIMRVMDSVGLTGRINHLVRTFSRGMQQRLSIARAVLHDPSILFLDEPETGLDQEARAILRELKVSSTGEKRTVVMSTHNLEHGLDMGDRVAILVAGRVVYQEARQALDLAGLGDVYCRCTGAKN